MKQIVLKAKKRELGKKSDLKTLRANELVPCVLYGRNVENVNFVLDEKELKKVTHSPNSYIVVLDIEGTKQYAVLHQLQFHPVSDATIHADFLAISEDRPIVINVPIALFGNSEGVKMGGKLVKGVRKVTVSGLMNELPDVIEVDVTPLKIGNQISAGDLHYNNFEIVSPKTTMICAVRSSRAVVADDSAEGTKPAEAPAAKSAE